MITLVATRLLLIDLFRFNHEQRSSILFTVTKTNIGNVHLVLKHRYGIGWNFVPLFGVAAMSVALTWAQTPPAAEREFSLKAESPKLWGLISESAKLEKVATGFKFTEGPLWDKSGFLYVSDEGLNKIFRVYPDGRTEQFADIRDPDGNTFNRKGQLVTCASQFRVVAVIAPDGSYEDSRRQV